jgi:flagellar basal-body rod protein FlgC
MSLYNSMKISSSALSAQRLRLELISSNLANIKTTRTADGGPYQRKDVVFKSSQLSFENILRDELAAKPPGVKVDSIYKDPRPFNLKYEPNHPDADQSGYVAYPNINVIEEMVNMISATRSFEANISVIEAAKSMSMRAIEIGV